ncbi:Fur family transcriptional regulator [Puniceicoccus vermicola]|uniref:Transcriptional repressor n=1 Tax=Puniceicoccus vermicola TaxID=388746 RepID=A0A7X1E2U2_9BACT|nr:transcriptional repressor [Puniceicoccus vermicola]MBC2600815.1 transcriptional repressor [Puniceicoccus vermicola]
MPTARKRSTRQRKAILEVLEKERRPLTFDQIFAGARELCPGLGERTVFRNLSEMVQEFELARVHYPGQPNRYELPSPDGEHHPHFICRECNQVFTLPFETPDVMDRIPQHPDFVYEGEEVVIFGRCRDCRSTGGAQ